MQPLNFITARALQKRLMNSDKTYKYTESLLGMHQTFSLYLVYHFKAFVHYKCNAIDPAEDNLYLCDLSKLLSLLFVILSIKVLVKV